MSSFPGKCGSNRHTTGLGFTMLKVEDLMSAHIAETHGLVRKHPKAPLTHRVHEGKAAVRRLRGTTI